MPIVEYSIEEMEFADRESAIEWIVDNQVGRRNLNADWFKYFLGREYRSSKKAHGGDRKSEESKPQNEGMITAELLAAKHNVGRATVERAGTDLTSPQNEEKLGFGVQWNSK